MAAAAEPAAFRPSARDVDECDFQNWYPRFRRLTMRSEVIPLSEEFVAFLHQDGIVLPPSLAPTQPRCTGFEDDHSEDAPTDQPPEPFFPDLVARISAAIDALGGAVMPKLNWSSPRDATWMLIGESTKCESAGDVILLLKSSDFVAHDLAHAYRQCEDAHVKQRPAQHCLASRQVLRRWSNLLPSREFRCFVWERRLVGISQRDVGNVYEHLQSEAFQDTLKLLVSDLFHRDIAEKFLPLHYAFDVYVDQHEKVWLVDFGTFGGSTDPLLFTWSELAEVKDAAAGVELRVAAPGTAVRPATNMVHRLPHDLLRLGGASELAAAAEAARAAQLEASESEEESEPSES